MQSHRAFFFFDHLDTDDVMRNSIVPFIISAQQAIAASYLRFAMFGLVEYADSVTPTHEMAQRKGERSTIHVKLMSIQICNMSNKS